MTATHADRIAMLVHAVRCALQGDRAVAERVLAIEALAGSGGAMEIDFFGARAAPMGPGQLHRFTCINEKGDTVILTRLVIQRPAFLAVRVVVGCMIQIGITTPVHAELLERVLPLIRIPPRQTFSIEIENLSAEVRSPGDIVAFGIHSGEGE